jgi:hypothetical protein
VRRHSRVAKTVISSYRARDRICAERPEAPSREKHDRGIIGILVADPRLAGALTTVLRNEAQCVRYDTAQDLTLTISQRAYWGTIVNMRGRDGSLNTGLVSRLRHQRPAVARIVLGTQTLGDMDDVVRIVHAGATDVVLSDHSEEFRDLKKVIRRAARASTSDRVISTLSRRRASYVGFGRRPSGISTARRS